jgi:hypothetical protein
LPEFTDQQVQFIEKQLDICAREAFELQKERDQLKKELSDAHEQLNWNKVAMSEARIDLENNRTAAELYDLREAFYHLDKEIISRNRTEEPITPERHKEIWSEIDRLMGDWYPGKEDNSGDNPADKKYDKHLIQYINEEAELVQKNWPSED